MTNLASRRRDILEAALALAQDRGPGGLTTVALARRMGFTEAALYRYFDGKGAILTGLLYHLAEGLFAAMGRELRPEEAEGPAAIVAQLQQHLERFAAQHGLLLALLLHAASSRSEPLLEAGNAVLEEYGQRMTVYFVQAQELGRLPSRLSAEELSMHWICQLLGGFLRSQLGRSPWVPHRLPGFKSFAAQLSQPLHSSRNPQ
jgi:AcrR family transcriptional regulator